MLAGQLIVDGFVIGLVFVILAAGLVLIANTSKILFMAYGAFYTIGSYATWYPVHHLKWPYFPSLLIGTATCAVLAMLTYILIFRRLKALEGGGFLATLIGAMGLSMALSQGGLLIYGTIPRSIPSVFKGTLHPFGLHITSDKLALVVMGIAITLFMFLIYEKTKLGRAMRAVSLSPEAASLQGVYTDRILLMTLGMGCALAGCAGGILAPSYGISPDMGSNVLWTVMLMCMLGGLDSLPGAVVAGVVIGQILSFGQFYVGSTVQIYMFLIIGLILYFRPNGLMGHGIDVSI